jgi:hypothetical protein
MILKRNAHSNLCSSINNGAAEPNGPAAHGNHLVV